MIEQRPNDGMIEIGDLEDEPMVTAGVTPQVVIEYRDRGIPWMLVPPLLAVVAVIAGVSAYNFNENRKERERLTASAVMPQALVGESQGESLPAEPLVANQPSPTPPVAPEAKVVENPATPPLVLTAPPRVADAPSPPAAAPLVLSPNPDPALTPAATAEPPLDPKSPGAAPASAVGFDPAIFGNPAPEVAQAQTSLAANSTPDLTPSNPAVVEVPVAATAPDQPELVDPDLLPPDPRKARVDRQQRALKALREAEAERFEFHARVAALYKKYKSKSGPMIIELANEFGQDIPPAAKDQAIKLLGRNGQFAGANTPRRINLLRHLGFPEPAILGDLNDLAGRHISDGERGAPSKDGQFLQAVVTLLQNPPNRPAAASRGNSAP